MDSTYEKLQVVEKCKDFQKATRVLSAPVPTTIGATDVLVRNLYAGVNATDLNAIENRYGPKQTVPYNIGLEALGQIAAVGDHVHNVAVGDYVVSYFPGGYSEYQVMPSSVSMKIPAPDPAYLAFTVSGLTAAVSIGEMGRPKPGQVALVTAAAGGTGSIAVQILKKRYGCRVVGTCSAAEKAIYLKSIGCDVVVDYTKSREEVLQQLQHAAPDGFDIIYESVGGVLRELSMQNVASHGRVIFIGSISGYRDGSSWREGPTMGEDESIIKGGLILRKSVCVSGFLLQHYRDVIPVYYDELLAMYAAGDLTVRIDHAGAREGLDKIAEAVEYLHSGKSYGKVIVKLADA